MPVPCQKKKKKTYDVLLYCVKILSFCIILSRPKMVVLLARVWWWWWNTRIPVWQDNKFIGGAKTKNLFTVIIKFCNIITICNKYMHIRLNFFFLFGCWKKKEKIFFFQSAAKLGNIFNQIRLKYFFLSLSFYSLILYISCGVRRRIIIIIIIIIIVVVAFLFFLCDLPTLCTGIW